MVKRDAGAGEVDVGDEGVEAVAVVVDAQPDHVPAGVVGVADAEDGELGLVDGIAGAPVEASGAALGVDVAGRPVGEELVVAALDVGALARRRGGSLRRRGSWGRDRRRRRSRR